MKKGVPPCMHLYSPSKWLRHSYVTGSRTFHNNDEGHRICMEITLIVEEDSKEWYGRHGDNPITHKTLTANTAIHDNACHCSQLKFDSFSMFYEHSATCHTISLRLSLTIHHILHRSHLNSIFRPLIQSPTSPSHPAWVNWYLRAGIG